MTEAPAQEPRAPRRPKHLGPSGAALWRDVVGLYALRADEVRILEAACREVDLCERLEDALRDAPLTVKGSQGQDVASPFVSELRQHRMALKGLLASLHLPDDDPARPARLGTFASATGRAAANARWSKTSQRQADAARGA